MEFVTQEILPPTIASAAALAVVETVEDDPILYSPSANASTPHPRPPWDLKTIVLATFRGTQCFVYEVDPGSSSSKNDSVTPRADPSSSSPPPPPNSGVKRLLFSDWIGSKVTHVVSTCEGSLTCLTDDLTIIILTFDLIRKRVLKRFQSPLPTDDNARVQRRSFTPALIASVSSGGQTVLCHGHEGYVHLISVKLILSAQITAPFEGAIKRFQLTKYAPYALSFMASDATQYAALYAATTTAAPSSASSSAAKIGSNNFYTKISKDRVTIVAQTPIDPNSNSSRYGSGGFAKNHRVTGIPFLVTCFTRLGATVVVTDEKVALILPEGGFTPAVTQFSHGIENLYENRIAVTSVFDTTEVAPLTTHHDPSLTNSTPPHSSDSTNTKVTKSIILGLSDGRYYRILLNNSANDCDAFSKEIDIFENWKAENAPLMPNSYESVSLPSPSPPTPLVNWNYHSSVRGLVTGVSPTNGDVFILKPSAFSVLPSSVASYHERTVAEQQQQQCGNSASSSSTTSTSAHQQQQQQLLRGSITGVIATTDLITSTSDGWIRRSQTVLDTDVIAQIENNSNNNNSVSSENNSAENVLRSVMSAAPAKVSYHPFFPTRNSRNSDKSVSIVVMSSVTSTQFMLKVTPKTTTITQDGQELDNRRTAENDAEETIEILFENNNNNNNNNINNNVSSSNVASHSFVTNEPTLGFGLNPAKKEAVQVTPSAIYWYKYSLRFCNGGGDESSNEENDNCNNDNNNTNCSEFYPSFTVTRTSSLKGNFVKAAIDDEGAIAVVEKLPKRSKPTEENSNKNDDNGDNNNREGGVNYSDRSRHVIKIFSREDSEMSVVDVGGAEISSLCVMPQYGDGGKKDVNVVFSYWGNTQELFIATASEEEKTVAFSSFPITFDDIDDEDDEEGDASLLTAVGTKKKSATSSGVLPSSSSIAATISALEPLNPFWAILQMNTGALYAQRIPLFSSSSAKKGASLPPQPPASSLTPSNGAPRAFGVGTLSVNKALSSIAVVGSTSVILTTIRTAGGGAVFGEGEGNSNGRQQEKDNEKNSHLGSPRTPTCTPHPPASTATRVVIVSERHYAVPTPFSQSFLSVGGVASASEKNKNNKNSNFNNYGGSIINKPLITALCFFGSAAELMRRPRIAVMAAAAAATTTSASPSLNPHSPRLPYLSTKTLVVDLRTSYSHEVIDEIKIGASVLNIMPCDSQRLGDKLVKKINKKIRKEKEEQKQKFEKRRQQRGGEKEEGGGDDDTNIDVVKESESAIDAAAAASLARGAKPLEPVGIIALVELESSTSTSSAAPPLSSFALILLQIKKGTVCCGGGGSIGPTRSANRLLMKDRRVLPVGFIPSCSLSTAQTPYSSSTALGGGKGSSSSDHKKGDEEKKTATDSNKAENEQQGHCGEIEGAEAEKGKSASAATAVKTTPPPAEPALSETYIVVGGCDITNGTGKLFVYTISGSVTFASVVQRSTEGPVNDVCLTVADNTLALVAATHFELLVFKFHPQSSLSAMSASTSILRLAATTRLASPVLSLASSLSVVAAASSGLVTYYEYSVGALRERTVEMLPLSTVTAMAGADGQFVKCDAQRNLFINVLAEKSRKVCKSDPTTDAYSVPLKASLRLPSWTTKIVAVDHSLGPIVDDNSRQYMSINTAFEAAFVVCAISKRYYICGADGALSVMVRVPSELFRLLIKLETCLENFIDHQRKDYMVSFYERRVREVEGEIAEAQQQEKGGGEEEGVNLLRGKLAKLKETLVSAGLTAHSCPQATWGIRDAKQCVAECRTLRASHIVDLKTVHTAFFDAMSEEERSVLVADHIQPECSDVVTPFTIASIIQRCCALL